MNIYLATIANHHNQIQRRYKYLILADSMADAIFRAKSDFDGKFTCNCELESIVTIPSLSDYAWYLPEYMPEVLN